MAKRPDDSESILKGFRTRKQLAEDLDVCTKTVQRLEERGLPVIRLIGRRPLYDPAAVREWIRKQ
jgi:phage terminase Nu1 subunit (DNA packaging protein)